MADSDREERSWSARTPDHGGRDMPAPWPGHYPPPAVPPRPPSRPAVPSRAQQRLVARIESGRRARRQRAALVASGLISALVLALSGGAWALTGYVNGNVGRVNAGTAGTPPSGPLNILLAGVDRRSGLTPAQQAQLHVGHVVSANSDTMMLIHLSADHTKVTVVSFPRDSWVDIPGHGMSKINAAYGLGGPKLMVQTVEQATGLTINDYIEVNFLSFVRVIDALGGVDICLPRALADSYSGLYLSAGKHHVQGITALKYARDRHSFATEDLARIDNQQRLLASLLNEAISGGTLANPVRLSRFLNAVLAAVRVDNGLNVAALADQMRSVSTSKVAFTTVPISDANYMTPDGQSAVQWDSAAAGRLFGAISSDKPLITPPHALAKPAPVQVDVYNGTLIGGLSASTGAQLAQLGFRVRAGLTWARQNVSQTVIYYRRGEVAAARQVRAVLPGAVLKQRSGPAAIRVVLGVNGYQIATPSSASTSGAGQIKAKTAAQNACR
jgi:LCP family protein required for cell wall assembly